METYVINRKLTIILKELHVNPQSEIPPKIDYLMFKHFPLKLSCPFLVLKS